MKPLKYHIILFLIGLLLSCAKKKYPESRVENDSVYNFAATVGGEPVSLKAGIGGYYMYSYYSQDSSNVYNFIGDLKQEGCTDCKNSLKIQINDFKVSMPNAPAKIDSSLFPRSYALLSGSNSFDVSFQSLFNKPAASYKWDFGDGMNSTDASPVHTYGKAGRYNVSLTVQSAGHCESRAYNTEQFDALPGTLRAYVTATAIGANAITFAPVISGGNAPYSYEWQFGDGLGSAAANPTHAYAIGGAYPVSLRVTDARNIAVTVRYNAVTQGDASSCAANYLISSVKQSAGLVTAKALSKIIVYWVDGSGVVYSSNSDLQPVSSHFEVLSVEDAGMNENNQPTKRLRLKFNCTVYSGSKALTIENAETTICVAYK